MDDYTARQIISALKDGIFITDMSLRIIEVNSVFTQVTGYTPEQAIGKTPSLLSSGRHTNDFYQEMWQSLTEYGYWQGTVWNRRKSGEIYPQWQYITTLNDTNGNTSHYLSVFSDLSRQSTSGNQLQLLAYYDNLTGLPNRELFSDRLNLSLSQALRDKGVVALFFMDLDRFKQINDTLGHNTGDKLLCSIASRLSKSLRESDTLARLSGDEFAIIVSGITSKSHAEIVAQKIQNCFKSPFSVDKKELLVSASIGISLYPEHGKKSETILRLADAAMYRAKKNGKNCYMFYTPELGHLQRQRLSIESDLLNAISNDDIKLVYQPQIDTQSGKIKTLEALIRWQHPDQGEIFPSLFLPIAEESGLILKLGYWAIKKACTEIANWRNSHGVNINLAINIFSLQIRSGNLFEIIQETISETSFPPAELELEVTESSIMEFFPDAISTFDNLNDLGIKIVIDNFGTGYSSLNTIKRIGVNKLKIHQSFIADIESNTNDIQMIKAIINMAHNLSMSVTAEGIKNDAQFHYIKDLSCDLAQGYLFGQPLSVDHLFSKYKSNLIFSAKDSPNNSTEASSHKQQENNVH
jgi:diguanylate cyclase (GGDEF)-like protein/PAS domain S-box-containing protein